ncbi:MAG: hypothetical protein EPO08_08910 [Rhodospirillaceae bacterium]|nr:MAG: hypothetical protein EPO08_08910 [Rhodospirillaceae bacterium]
MSRAAPNESSQSIANHAVRACLFAVPVAFAVMAVAFGQDSNWDLRNYHWYNPYAFLTGRLTRDLGVAHVATFYNPILDIPTFLAGSVLPARVMAAILGFVHGLNFLLLYGLADRLLSGPTPGWRPDYRRLAAVGLGLVGMLGGGHLALVGTTFNDNVVSLAEFGGALLIAVHADTLFAPTRLLPTRREGALVIGAGLLLGLAVGLKLPATIFAVGFCLAFLFVGGGAQRRLALAFIFGVGVVAAFVVAGGPWMWLMWRDYANPVFPYFNTVFHSPMGMEANYRDVRFVPKGVAEILGFPVVFSVHPDWVGEISFRDYRILAAYCALIITGAIALTVRFRRGSAPSRMPPTARYLIAAAAGSYAVWILIFGIYRYIVPLEMLSPLLFTAAVASWPIAGRLRMAVIVMVLLVVTVTVHRGDWEHSPWQEGPFVTATPPPIERPDQTLAIITGTNPVGWLIPFFPPQIPFIRIYGYMNAPGQVGNGMNDAAQALIDAHQGDFFLVAPEKEFDNAVSSLRAYRLRADFDTCRPVPSNLGDYVRWCRVYRMSEPPVPLPS